MGCGGSKTVVIESHDKQEKPKELATDEKPKETTKGIECEEKGDGFKDYEISALNLHNTLRSRHGGPDMTLNRDLCDMAQKYAEHLLKNDLFGHASGSEREWNGEEAGENLGKSVGSRFDNYDATQAWYDEIKDYNFETAEFSPGVGHFTQLVWKESITLGVGVAKDPRTMTTVMVARYHPPGNYTGQFEENVSRPR